MPNLQIACGRIIISPIGEWCPEQGREWGEMFQGDGVDDAWGIVPMLASRHLGLGKEGERSSTAQSSADTPIGNTGIEAPAAVSPLIASMHADDNAHQDVEIGTVDFEVMSGVGSDLFLVPEYRYQSMLHEAQKCLEQEDVTAKALQGMSMLLLLPSCTHTHCSPRAISRKLVPCVCPLADLI